MTAAILERPAPSGRARTAAPRTQRRSAPKLLVLDQQAIRRRARRRNALLILFIAVIVGFFAVAFVHAALVGGQQELDAVRSEISQAEARHAEMARAVEAASAPDVIVTRAVELGMVRANEPVYLEVAAPLRDVEVIPMNASTAGVGSSDAVSKVAAPVPVDEDGGAIVDDVTGTGGSSISAAIGIEAGVSIAGRLPEKADPPIDVAAAVPSADVTTLAGAAGSVAGADASASTGGSAVAGAAGGSGDDQGGSATSIAGTRAVSGGTGSG